MACNTASNTLTEPNAAIHHHQLPIPFAQEKNFQVGLLINNPDSILEKGFESWTTEPAKSIATIVGVIRHTTNVSMIESPADLLFVKTDHHPMLLLAVLPYLRSEGESGSAPDWRQRTPVDLENLQDDPVLQEAIKVFGQSQTDIG